MVSGVAIVVREYLRAVRHVQLSGAATVVRECLRVYHRGTGVLSDGVGLVPS